MNIHESLVQTDDAEVTIEASADVLKPIFAYPRHFVDELKLQVTEDGLEYSVVDPANVAQVHLEAPASEFDTYDVDETTIGINLGQVRRALRAGRKRNADTITMSYTNERMTTTVHRDYDGTAMSLQNSFKTIDPDTIREMPDMPELELPASATVPRSLFNDTVSAVDEVANHFHVRDTDGDLVVGGEGDTDDCTVVVEDVVEGSGADTMLSLDYFKSAVKAFKAVGMDEVTMTLGEDMPAFVEWKTESMSGEWIQAPRIRESGGDDE